MKIITTVMMSLTALVLMLNVTGCATARNAMQDEYKRLSTTPPEPPARCEYDRAIDNLGVAVGVNYAFSHKLMKEYVSATENRREYLGFLNDVKYYIDEEKLDEKAAVDKVVKGIMAEDEKITNPEEKVWPRVVEGINATNSLKIENKLKEIIPVLAANAKNLKTVTELKNSFNGLDATVIAKGVACAKIAKQATFTAECLTFIAEQFRRTLVARYYAK